MSDKDLIMSSVKGLLSMHEEYGFTTLSAFITKMVKCPVDDHNVYAAVLRKFGHQILNRVGFQDNIFRLHIRRLVTNLFLCSLENLVKVLVMMKTSRFKIVFLLL